jgi:hypothetical protein
MKKYLLSLAILIAASVGAKAQLNIGIKGGVNLSNINTDNLSSSNRTGYQAGVFARIGGGLYVQPEVYVSGTGGNFHANDNSVTGNVHFTNLNIPVLLGKRFGTSGTNFRIMAGPIYTGVLSHSLSQSLSDAYHDFGKYNSGTLGYQAGVGVDILGLTADLRYEGGLTKLNSNYGQRANIFSLSVGFKIL